MSAKLRRILILLGALSLLALPFPATAGEGEGSDPADDPPLVYQYDSFVHVLIYGFDETSDPDPPLNCDLPEGVTVEIDFDGVITLTGPPAPAEPFVLPPECKTLNVEGPNGQVNHGTFVSAFVHELKAGFEGFGGDMPFGRYVRQFAKSDFDGSNADGDLTSTESANGSKPRNGRGHGKKNA